MDGRTTRYPRTGTSHRRVCPPRSSAPLGRSECATVSRWTRWQSFSNAAPGETQNLNSHLCWQWIVTNDAFKRRVWYPSYLNNSAKGMIFLLYL